MDLTLESCSDHRRESRSGRSISLEDVLGVLEDFDQFGGGSLQLVAWELFAQDTAVAPAWARAVKHGYLERVGTDPTSGEETWRLTTRGRRATATRDDANFSD